MVRFLLSTILFSCAPKSVSGIKDQILLPVGSWVQRVRGSGGNSSVIHYPYANVRQTAISSASLNLWVHLSTPIDRTPISMGDEHSVSVYSIPRLVCCGPLLYNLPTTVPPLNEHPNPWYHRRPSQSRRPNLRQTPPRLRRLVAEATKKIPVSFVMRTWIPPLILLL